MHPGGPLLALGSILLLAAACAAEVDEPGAPAPEPDDAAMTMRATGTFEVTITPEATQEEGEVATGRSSLEKRFRGDLEGTSAGEMLTAMTGVEGSAGYVAIERVRGTLGGRSGTFVLQHTGTMARGEQSLSVSVVPDSGTGELAGITGTMTIDVQGGEHSYVFDYDLGDRP